MPIAALNPDVNAALTVVWLTVLGAAVGSFLNVVVFRVPLGQSIIEPRSYCPRCKKPVRWFDNVPLLSWIVLRGRCRDCRAPISMRYPLVEVATAALFGILAARQYVSYGANLPPQPTELSGEVSGTGLIGLEVHEVYGGLQIYGIYCYHLLLLCTLFAAALIEYDGNRPPKRIFVPAAVVGLLAPLGWPHLHPVAAWDGLNGIAAGAVDGTLGLVVGGGIGLVPWWMFWKEQPSAAIFALACVGIFLGWQAALVLGLLTVVISLSLAVLGRRRPALRRLTPTAWLAAATFAWILAWAPLVGWLERL